MGDGRQGNMLALTTLIDKVLKMDTNKDGKISFDEWKAGALTSPEILRCFSIEREEGMVSIPQDLSLRLTDQPQASQELMERHQNMVASILRDSNASASDRASDAANSQIAQRYARPNTEGGGCGSYDYRCSDLVYNENDMYCARVRCEKVQCRLL